MLHRARTLIVAAVCLLAAAVPARATILTPYTSQTSTGSVNFAWTAAAAPYTAVFSTSPSFTPSVTSAAGSAAANYASLDPNTAYYFKVKVSAEDDGQYSQTSTATWTIAPGGIYSAPSYFTAGSSFTAVASIGWNTGGNPEWTAYDLYYSTAPGSGLEVISPKNNPLGAPLPVSGLNSNTTYYFKVRARGISGTVTSYTPLISTATLALKLTELSDVFSETSATMSWRTVDDPAIPALQSEGYRLDLYLNAAMSPPAERSWTTEDAAVSSVSFSGLTPNTRYYYRAGALNLSGAPNPTAPRSFTTLSPVPQDLTRVAAAAGSATLAWTALAEGTALGYRLEASTTNFTAGGLTHSSATDRMDLNTLTINTLDANTTYYFRAASLNSAYNPNYTPYYSSPLSSVTLATPVSVDLVYVNAAPQEITVSFNPLLDFPQALACEGYRLELSSSPAAWTGGGGTVLSSVTYTYQNQLRSLTIQGLASNTTYYLRLGTLNWELTPNYTILPSTRTGFPGQFTGVTLTDVWSSSAAVHFSPGVAAVGHAAEASTDRFFTPVSASSATPDTAASGLVITGLAPDTLYYFRAGALYNGTTLYANSVPESRQTLPQQLTGLNFPGVFQTSVTVGWTTLPALGATAESYRLQAAAGPDFNPVLFSSITSLLNLSGLTISGLEPNTSYYFRAGTVNLEGSVNYALTPATSTMANLPEQRNYTGLTPLAMTINWLPNSNPDDTLYLVRISSNSPFLPPIHTLSTTDHYASFAGLEPNTTYYPELTAYNRLNRPSPVVEFSSMATGAYDPEPEAYTGLGVSSVTLNWDDALPPYNPAGTKYLAYISSRSDFSGTVLSSITPGFTASFSGLVANASYYLRVSALNLTGIPTDPAIFLGAALTLPATAYILPPQQTFSDILTDGFSVSWAANGNSSFTAYNVQVSTAADFSVISSSLSSVRAETCDFSSLLLDTTYWVRVQARGQSGALSSYETAGSVKTLLYTLLNSMALRESTISLETSYGTISVLLPQGAIGSSTRLRLQPFSSFAAPDSAVSELTPTGVGIALTHFPPTLVLKAITITLPYRISDLPPAMRSQAERTRLILALYDETNAI